MPRTRGNAAAAKAVEPVEPAEPEEQVDLEEDDSMEEEVEYEEVEEEVEEEEEEEEEEEAEEEEEEEEEEEVEEVEEVEEGEEDENISDNGADSDTKASEDGIEVDERDEDEIKEHAELLALPPHGSEVYVGGIPRDASEEDLKRFCESAGEVTEVRMIKDMDSSENKGYAFVTFKTKELASKAITDLSNAEFKGKKIKCSTSQSKHRLFIGNVPRNWVEDDLKKAVIRVGPGVVTVELMMDPKDTSRNRGFAFIEYYNHACAEYSRKKMITPKFRLDSNAPTVSWAEPKIGDSPARSQIKAVYVKNIPKEVTEDQLRKLFEHHGKIGKVILPPLKSGQDKRFGFVHFKERPAALKALKNTERYEIYGEVLECSLAKPPAEKKVENSSQKVSLLPSYAPRGYGVVGAGYGSPPPVYPPMMPHRPAGMAMVPMILPDGRLGYVLQQPGGPVTPQHRGGGGGGSRSRSSSSNSGGRKGNDKSRGSRFNPY